MARDNDNDNDNGARVPTWDPCARAFVWRPFDPWPNHTRTEALKTWRTCARAFWHERDNAQTGAPRAPVIDEQARALSVGRSKNRRAQAKQRALAEYRTGAASMLASAQAGRAQSNRGARALRIYWRQRRARCARALRIYWRQRRAFRVNGARAHVVSMARPITRCP